jgi:hypothetical protein
MNLTCIGDVLNYLENERDDMRASGAKNTRYYTLDCTPFKIDQAYYGPSTVIVVRASFDEYKLKQEAVKWMDRATPIDTLQSRHREMMRAKYG